MNLRIINVKKEIDYDLWNDIESADMIFTINDNLNYIKTSIIDTIYYLYFHPKWKDKFQVIQQMMIFSNLWIGSMDTCDIKVSIEDNILQLKVKLYYPSLKPKYDEYYINVEKVEENMNTNI